jgi:hypothetical protein
MTNLTGPTRIETLVCYANLVGLRISKRLAFNSGSTFHQRHLFHAGAHSPKHNIVLDSGEVVMKRAAPLIVNPFARRLAGLSLGLAIISWSHYELNLTRRKQTPLPLAKRNIAISVGHITTRAGCHRCRGTSSARTRNGRKDCSLGLRKPRRKSAPLSALAWPTWHRAPRLNDRRDGSMRVSGTTKCRSTVMDGLIALNPQEGEAHPDGRCAGRQHGVRELWQWTEEIQPRHEDRQRPTVQRTISAMHW